MTRKWPLCAAIFNHMNASRMLFESLMISFASLGFSSAYRAVVPLTRLATGYT